jgi:predicted AAA+ superfamily ATPase
MTDELIAWKSRTRRKPLLIYGARQVGKTHVLKEFGAAHYPDVAYFNLEQSSHTASVFNEDYEPERLIALLAAQRGRRILPGETLLILDEIQKNSRAITALKYFQEMSPEYHVAAAGSLLGITLGRQEDSFPVGKVNTLTLCPLDFEEFLWALGQELLADEIRGAADKLEKFMLHENALAFYRQYLAVGGMPESVIEFLEKPDLIGFGESLHEINQNYIADMVKYAGPLTSARIAETWESVPGQLCKANHKFQYNKIRSGSRASQYELPITWLQTARIINKCCKAETMREPLGITADSGSFRVYLGDTGLLCAKLEANPAQIAAGTVTSDQFRGILAENYVMQHLVSQKTTPSYWKSPGKAEVEFVYQSRAAGIIPIEVKSSDNVRSPSLNVFMELNSPEFAIRISSKNFGFHNRIKSIPLYAAFCLNE